MRLKKERCDLVYSGSCLRYSYNPATVQLCIVAFAGVNTLQDDRKFRHVINVTCELRFNVAIANSYGGCKK